MFDKDSKLKDELVKQKRQEEDMKDKDRCEECGSWEAQCSSDIPVQGCGCARCLSDAHDVALYERDAYKKAKEENDERFMRERDEAQAEVKRLRVSSGRLYDALRQLHEACCCSCRTCQSAKVEAYDAMEAYKEGK